jgi:hypothetical protein
MADVNKFILDGTEINVEDSVARTTASAASSQASANTQDIADLKETHPDYYEIICDNIFNDKTGYFITKSKTKDGYKEKCRGMNIIDIPTNEKIPEWLQPYIDINTMVNNILAPFYPVLEILNVKTVEEGKQAGGTNRKTNTISNIIKF